MISVAIFTVAMAGQLFSSGAIAGDTVVLYSYEANVAGENVTSTVSGWSDPYNAGVGAYDVTLPNGVVGVVMGKLAQGPVMNAVPSSAPLQTVTLNSRAGYETFARAQNAAFAAASVYHNTMYTVRLNLNNGRTITLRGSTVRAEPIVWKINNPALVKNISAQRTISAGSLVVA